MDSLKKMFCVIFRPNKIFNELKDRPVFVAPLLLIVLSMVLLSSLSVFIIPSLDNAMDKKISEPLDEEESIKEELGFLKEDGASPEELRVEEKILRGQKVTSEDIKAMRKYLKRDRGYSDKEIDTEIKHYEEIITEDNKWEAEDNAKQKELDKRIKNIKNNLPVFYGYQIFSTVLSLLLSALSFFVVGIIIKRRKSYMHALSLVTVSYGPIIFGLVLFILYYAVNLGFSSFEPDFSSSFELARIIGGFVLSFLVVISMFALVVWSIFVLVKGFAIIYKTPLSKSLLIVLLVIAINLAVTYPLSFLFGF